MIFGLLKYDYAGFFAAVGICSTFLGQSVVDWFVKKYNKDSVVILVIGGIMWLAVAVMVAAGAYVTFQPGTDNGFQELCPAPVEDD